MAARVMEETEALRLSNQPFDAFWNACEAAPAPNAVLQAAQRSVLDVPGAVLSPQHGVLATDPLLTRDIRRYSAYFPSVRLISPDK